MSYFNHRDPNIGSYYLPPFCSKISATTYGKKWFHDEQMDYVPQTGCYDYTRETPYSNKKVLVENWEEELSDIRNREYWKKEIGNKDHYYLTTYDCSYNRHGIIIPPKRNFKRFCSIPCHQPELDPYYMHLPKFYQSVTQTSYRDPASKKNDRITALGPKSKEAATQTFF